MSAQKVKLIDVEVEFSKETVLALDELSTVLGRSRDELMREAIKKFVVLLKYASGTGHTAVLLPTAE